MAIWPSRSVFAISRLVRLMRSTKSHVSHPRSPLLQVVCRAGALTALVGAEMPPRGKAVTSSDLSIFFNPYRPRAPPLTIPVVTVEHENYDRASHSFETRGTQYQLDTDRFSLNENMLVDWASSQMRSEDDGFQSALDHLVMSFIGTGGPNILPHVSTGLTIS